MAQSGTKWTTKQRAKFKATMARKKSAARKPRKYKRRKNAEGADATIAAAVARGDHKLTRGASRKTRHIVRIYWNNEDGQIQRERRVIHSWGELFDLLMSADRGGADIEEIYMECNLR